MRLKELQLILLALISFVLVYVPTQLNFKESFIIALQIYTFLRFINNIGHTVCFYDFLCFSSVLTTLALPIVGYRIFNVNNTYARVWLSYMRVPEDTYYDFVIPCNIVLIIGCNLLISKIKSVDYQEIFRRLEIYAADKGKAGIVLTAIGFVSSLFPTSGNSLSFVFYLFSMLKYVGPIYVYFSNLRFRMLIFSGSIALFFMQALALGMFGEFLMYTSLTFMLLAFRFRLRFVTKFLCSLFLLFLVMMIQMTKPVYRQITWAAKTVEGLSVKENSEFEIFSTLFINRVTTPSRLFVEEPLFKIYMRLNQGWLISRAMDYVPRVEPFADGETMIRTFGAIVIPRILWPDKPEAGGYENLSRFVGIKKKLRYSMNIGPYGEAYGNFGPIAGIGFVFLYALLLSYLLKLLLVKSLEIPSLLLWSPLLFYYTLTVETDIFGTINFVVKTGVFIVIVFWASRKFFKATL